jgi:hypothetical protein
MIYLLELVLTVILPISASQVARITGTSHQCPAKGFLKYSYLIHLKELIPANLFLLFRYIRGRPSLDLRLSANKIYNSAVK